MHLVLFFSFPFCHIFPPRGKRQYCGFGLSRLGPTYSLGKEKRQEVKPGGQDEGPINMSNLKKKNLVKF